jgi:two-component system sensor histidine kinase ChiS
LESEELNLNSGLRLNAYCHYLRHFFALMSLVLFCIPALAQPMDNERDAPRLSFKHILPTQIAAIGYINSISQDTQGFMWFGGANGLARYDGYDLTIFRHDDKDPKSISHSYINRIMLSRDGNMWVATRNGINLFDARQHSFQSFKVSPDARIAKEKYG